MEHIKFDIYFARASESIGGKAKALHIVNLYRCTISRLTVTQMLTRTTSGIDSNWSNLIQWIRIESITQFNLFYYYRRFYQRAIWFNFNCYVDWINIIVIPIPTWRNNGHRKVRFGLTFGAKFNDWLHQYNNTTNAIFTIIIFNYHRKYVGPRVQCVENTCPECERLNDIDIIIKFNNIH